MAKQPDNSKQQHELAAFQDFKFELGQRVMHRAAEWYGVITNRALIQSQTGNTGRGYYVALGNSKLIQVQEIELDAPAE